ncbi:hypothetical protein TSUD_202940 [Trifolium subterraneum]|uniref:Uncharacterized protein n=1 Tax=Trifolium subterraneum TaxID=3900 RepID=A0A2Z6MQD8_TRISU|nr:hypothetical protein TSUD_202940 [Trifolium subterraneum]
MFEQSCSTSLFLRELRRAKRGAPIAPLAAATPVNVVAVSVIMLMLFSNRLFQFWRCSPTFLCISILSDTDSKIA